MPTAKNVTVIPATLNMHTKAPTAQRIKLRVAGYARVSTDSDEQFTSNEAQVDYYTSFIKENPDWEFVGIYTDEGISGTNTKHREGFNRMIQDALDGKIDLIVTKSVSRFARNTVDSLTTIRKLKEAGCECMFQKENIMTFDSKGELLITIMSSLAQEESRSISENVTWGQRKRFADGKVTMPYKHFLGYRKSAEGVPEIVPEEAVTVRKIYRLAAQGHSTGFIAKILTADGDLTPTGKTVWAASTVKSILTNERYKGAALLQKKFTVDFLTKKTKINEGEVPQYYVEDSHPAIIDPTEWDAVQTILSRRVKNGSRHYSDSPFAGKVICGDCGEAFSPKVWHSTDKYRRVVWRCNRKYESGEKCETPHLTESQLKSLFLRAVSEYFSDRDALIEDLRTTQRFLSDTTFIDADIRELEQELADTADLIRLCVSGNASNALTEAEYRETHARLCGKYEQAELHLRELSQQRKQMQEQEIAIGGLLFEIKELTALPIEFNEKLWNIAVDHVTVYADEHVVFHFRDGKEISLA